MSEQEQANGAMLVHAAHGRQMDKGERGRKGERGELKINKNTISRTRGQKCALKELNGTTNELGESAQC